MAITTIYWTAAFISLIIFTIFRYPLAYIALFLQIAEDLIRIYNKIVDLRLSREARKETRFLIEVAEGRSEFKTKSPNKYERLLIDMIGIENLEKSGEGKFNFNQHEDKIHKYVMLLYKEIYQDDYMDYDDWASKILKGQ